MFVHCHCQNIHYYCQNRHFTPKYTLWMVLLVEPHLYTALLGGWVKEDVGCKTGTLHCCCRVDATADSRSRLLRLQNKPNILPFVCKKCSSCQKTCISATVRLHPYVTLGYDCLLDPSWDCLMAPNQSASTSISVAEKLLCFELYYGTTGLKIFFLFPPVCLLKTLILWENLYLRKGPPSFGVTLI